LDLSVKHHEKPFHDQAIPVIARRRVLEMTRAGEIPAHSIGEGKR